MDSAIVLLHAPPQFIPDFERGGKDNKK